MPSQISLALLIGQTIPRPVSTAISEALESLEVTHQMQGRSGFQLVFRTGRSDASSLTDDVFLKERLFDPFSRVIVTVTIGAMPHVLLDGIITRHEFSPSMEPGESRFTVTGEDVSIMMDLEEKADEHIALDDRAIVNKLLLSYAKYGLIPAVTKPQAVDQPTPQERTPVQLATDLEHIQALADRHGFLFYITPGPAVGQNTAYWGPPQRKGQPHKVLLFNMQGQSTVDSINAQYDALAPTRIKGQVQDRKTNQVQPVSIDRSKRTPLSQEPALTTQSKVRTVLFQESGRLTTGANARAQAMLDCSTDSVVTVVGQLETLAYGDILQAGRVAELRGVGQTYDGRFYVSQVTHTIVASDYRQRFTLIREGRKVP